MLRTNTLEQKEKGLENCILVWQFLEKKDPRYARCFLNFLNPCSFYTSKCQQMYDLTFALHLWLWRLWSFCVWILCHNELCHCSEQLGTEYSLLRQEMLSKPSLASQRVVNMFCFPRSKVSISLPPSVLLLKNSIGPIDFLNDVHGLYQLFPCLPLLCLFIMFMVYGVPFISKCKTPK